MWSRFDVDIKRLIRFAEEGLLEVRISCPDTYTEVTEKELIEFIVDYSWEYYVVDPQILKDLVSRGLKSFKAGSRIQFNKQIQTAAALDLSDMVVTAEEIKRFETKYFGENVSESNVTNNLPPPSITGSLMAKQRSKRSSQTETTEKRNQTIRKVAMQIVSSHNGEKFLRENRTPKKVALAQHILRCRANFEELKGHSITQRIAEKALVNLTIPKSE